MSCLCFLSCNNENMQEILSPGLRFVSCRASTLFSPGLYVRHEFNRNWLTTTGFYRCGQATCTVCKFAKNTQSFVSSSNGNSYYIGNFINCNSRFVIYSRTGNSCNLQYVGSTSTPLKVGIRKHLSDINRPLAVNISTVSRCFLHTHAVNTLSFTFVGIDKVSKPIRGGDHRKKLLSRESLWIFNLGSRIPCGLNIKQDISVLIMYTFVAGMFLT